MTTLLVLLCYLPYFQALGKSAKNITSNDIRDYLQAGYEHPATLFPGCFSSAIPVSVITYQLSLSLDDVFSYLNPEQIALCNKEFHKRVPIDMAALFVWIDVLFIDQMSTDIPEMLLVSQLVYEQAQFHLALTTVDLFSRCWCLFELGVRHLKGKQTLFLTSPRYPIGGLGQRMKEEISRETFGSFFQKMNAFKVPHSRQLQPQVVLRDSRRRFGRKRRYDDWSSESGENVIIFSRL